MARRCPHCHGRLEQQPGLLDEHEALDAWCPTCAVWFVWRGRRWVEQPPSPSPED
jgi:hypothetical protein